MQIFDKLEPKGYVVIRDKDGKILRAHYNTIVNDGKKTLIAKLLSNFLSAGGSTEGNITNEDSKYNFHGLCFGCNTRETTTLTSLDGEYREFLESGGRNPFYFTLQDTTNPENSKFITTNNSDHGVSEFNVKFDKDNQRYYLSTTVRVIPGTAIETDDVEITDWEDPDFKNAVCSLAIIMKHKETVDPDKQYRMFSRFRFDPIPINSESEFILTYYIYF